MVLEQFKDLKGTLTIAPIVAAFQEIIGILQSINAVVAYKMASIYASALQDNHLETI